MRSAEPFHPSEYIRNEIEARGWSTSELARRVGTNEEGGEALLTKRFTVDDELAKRLGRAFGTGPELWLNLQRKFDEDREALATRLLRRFLRMRSDIQQLVNDIEWWNDNRTEYPPFDCEGHKLALMKLDRCIDCVKRRIAIPNDLWDEFCAHLDDAQEIRLDMSRES